MRAIDLTPPEERRGGERGPTRAGALSYVLVSALALGLLAVIALAFIGKQVSDREAEVAGLEQELAAATARATALRPFAEFRAIQEARAGTVTSLAQSRFDWERVIRELSRVLPTNVWLVSLTGTAAPEVSVQNASSITTRSSIAGPALELIGCAPGQDAVAAFAAALEDIDGVTRVGVAAAQRPEQSTAVGGSAGGSQDDCRTRGFISRFEIVVAFDAVPVPDGAVAPPPSVPAPLAPSGDGAQLTEAQQSAGEQVAKADNATDRYIPGG